MPKIPTNRALTQEWISSQTNTALHLACIKNLDIDIRFPIRIRLKDELPVTKGHCTSPNLIKIVQVTY